VASTSCQHLRSRSNRPAHSKLPTIQEEVNQPRANAAPGVDLRASLDKNRRGRDARGYIDQRHREREERELRRRLDYDRESSDVALTTITIFA
jgi:ribosomal protein L2